MSDDMKPSGTNPVFCCGAECNIVSPGIPGPVILRHWDTVSGKGSAYRFPKTHNEEPTTFPVRLIRNGESIMPVVWQRGQRVPPEEKRAYWGILQGEICPCYYDRNKVQHDPLCTLCDGLHQFYRVMDWDEYNDYRRQRDAPHP